MKSSQKYPLEKLIHVDEFTVGGKEEGKQGRKLRFKKEKGGNSGRIDRQQ